MNLIQRKRILLIIQFLKKRKKSQKLIGQHKVLNLSPLIKSSKMNRKLDKRMMKAS
jgi:hypothetical protein